MLTATSLEKRFGAQVLFENASFQFDPGQRYGIVGANGSGKSTLLKLLTGEMSPDAGDVVIPKRLRVGVLGQDHFQYENTPIIHVVMMGHAELWKAMEEKEVLLANAENEFDVDRYSALEDIILQHDGYGLESRAAEILEGLQIPSKDHFEPLSILSGGFKLRVLLAQTLAAEPDMLLLDEPTNHLDILSIAWLEQFLVKFKGTVAVVSHDHHFLDVVSTRIVDVDYQQVTVYTGDYKAFEAAKKEARERKESEIQKQEKEIAEQKAFIDRFKAKASKARQAQSRVKRVEKMVITKLAESSRKYPKFNLKELRNSGRQVLEAVGISKAYDDNQVLRDVDLKIARGDRVAIIGPNGIGKSTLLKIITDNLEADEGVIEWGHEVRVGYFAQDHKDSLSGSDTVLSWLWDQYPTKGVGFIRGKLAEVLFTRDDVDKKVVNLSGGESARLVFAGLGVLKPNVMVLDEPTNHLDIEGIDALATGLEAYDGTLIFVSHDRWFVSRLATRIIEIRPDGVEDFKGTYPEYLAKQAGSDHLDKEAVQAKAREEKRAAKNAKKKKKKGKNK